MQVTETVKQLIIINIIFFVGTIFLGGPAIEYLALHFPAGPDFKVWQPLTYMFMHGGIMHILFNMLALAMFGSLLEYMWGTKKFLFFYFSCGVGAAAFHLGIDYILYQDVMGTLTQAGFNKADIIALASQDKYNPEWMEYITERQYFNFLHALNGTMLGASGVMYGVMVAFACLFPNNDIRLLFIPIPIKAKYFLPGMLCLDLYLGLKGQSFFGGRWSDGVAHFAHLGGALIGFIMMWNWSKGNFNHNRWN
ncbi:protease [Flavobacterium akiainvivens]|uniref:Protease n=2 Tax=Flavobacterium akiainvivens TaxID=1202724 RepID=A0A0M9VK49_9FLAO|nr:protease [Flavobacterium akiainvivens]